jgi:hypothetical protein
VVADRAGYANSARLGDPFQSGRDIDPIAVDVAFLNDDVAQIDAHTKHDLLLLRRPQIALSHPSLHGNRASDSLYDARELDQDAVAGGFDDAAFVLGNLWIDEFVAVLF